MADTRGTFRLKEVRQDILNSEYVAVPSVWIANNNFGHGSYLPGNLVRYNTSNSTVTNTSNQASTNDGPGGGSQTQTYWSGGGSNSSNIRKLTYSTYTYESNLPIDILTPARNAMGTVSKETDVYYTGSAYPSIGTQSSTQKLTFSSDSIALVPGSPYPTAQSEQASFTGGGLYGYFWSGVNSPVNSKLNRLTFSNDTFTIIPASVSPTAYRYGWNLGNTTKGYVVGGVWVSTARKLTYSDETFVAAPSANYPRAIGTGVAFTAGADTGLYTAGRNSSGPGYYSDTHLLTFSTDSWALDSAMNNTATPTSYDYGTGKGTSAMDSKLGDPPSYTEDGSKRWFDSASSNMKGYFTGGIKLPWATAHTGTQKLDYSTETFSSPPANLPSVHSPSEMGSTGNASDGILATGSGGSGISKFTYSSETYTYTGNMPGNYQPYFRFQQGHTSTTAAYFSGGHYAYTGTHTYKMPYSSDVATYTPSANLNSKRDQLNGTGMSKHDSHGYVIGGYDQSYHTWGAGYTNSEKMTYASDTFAILPGMNTTGGSRYSTAAVGIPGLNGYWLTGVPSPSGVAGVKSQCGKVDFSTDSMGSLPNVPYNMIGKQQCALGGGDRVYFGGGWRSYAPSGPTNVSSLVSKIVCSTDAISLIPGGMPFGVDKAASVSQVENGFPIKSPDLASDGTSTAPTPTASTYEALSPSLNANAVFAAGRGPSSSSPSNNRSKLTFSNDSMASMPAFTANYNGYGNASSTTRGYLTGGWGTNAMGDTQNKRWYNQYSNDTSGQLPGSIPYNAGGFFSVSNETKLYAGGGGWSSGQYSSVHKMAFSNETNAGVPGMKLTMPLKNCAGVGDKTVGFICGANYYNNWRSYISKITYATETIATSPATLAITGSSPYYGATGTSSKTKGYIMAGNATDKLTFSTDTISTLGSWSSGLSSAWPGTSANSATAGYTMFGSNPSANLSKFTFATEGASSVPSVFSPARSKGGGMSQAMFGGAYSPAPYLI